MFSSSREDRYLGRYGFISHRPGEIHIFIVQLMVHIIPTNNMKAKTGDFCVLYVWSARQSYSCTLLLGWQHYYCVPERRCWFSLMQLHPGLLWMLSFADWSVMGTKSANGSWWQAQISKQEWANLASFYLSFRKSRDYVRCWYWTLYPTTDCRSCSALIATQAALTCGCVGKFVCQLS